MALHLAEISQAVAQGAHAILLMDQAGWHSSAKLDVPDNITIVLFPSRSPELNLVEISGKGLLSGKCSLEPFRASFPGGVLRDRRSSRADANGSNSPWSRTAAAAWPGRHQWRLGAQPPFAAPPLVFARRFGEPMSSFVRLLVKAHDARERDALFG